ncbi:hypothetical protein GCM10023336_77640 [Streptomyces similanensis]|uniref:Uncharacterized protein n=1 Tax=Streptomyces similanensis TaxID=1274988 RepID=A0ABP9LT49_9ACTN
MHHRQHRPRRLASAEPATVTVATAYEGAVMMTTKCPNHALTCPDGGVRFGGYNGRVMITPVSESSASTAAAVAAKVVA